MASEIVRVETVGQIKPPMSTAAMTPEEAASGHNTVTMVFDKPVTLTVEHGMRIAYPVGTHEVPDHLADHWYLAAHNVRPYARPIKIGAEVAPAAKTKKSGK